MVVGMYVCATRDVLQVGTPPRNFPIVKNAAVPIFSTSICVEKFFSSSKVGGGEIRTSCFGRAHFCSYPPSRLVTSTSLMDHAAVIPIADVHLELDVHRKVRIAGLYVMNFFFLHVAVFRTTPYPPRPFLSMSTSRLSLTCHS